MNFLSRIFGWSGSSAIDTAEPHEALRKTSSWKLWSGWPFSLTSTPSHDRRADSSGGATLTFSTPSAATIKVASKETASPALNRIEAQLTEIEKAHYDAAPVVQSWRGVVAQARALREFVHWFNGIEKNESRIEGYSDASHLVLKIEKKISERVAQLGQALDNGKKVSFADEKTLTEAISDWEKACEDFKRLVATAKTRRAAFEEGAKEHPLTAHSSKEERETFYALEQNANALESAAFRARKTIATACSNFETALISHLQVPKEIASRSSSPSMLTATTLTASLAEDASMMMHRDEPFNSMQEGEEHDDTMTESDRGTVVSAPSFDAENDQMSHTSISNNDDEASIKKSSSASASPFHKTSSEEVPFDADRESIDSLSDYGDGIWTDVPDSETYLASIAHKEAKALSLHSTTTDKVTSEELRSLSLARAQVLRSKRLTISQEREVPTGERLLQDFPENASRPEKVGTLTRLIAVAHDKLKEAREALQKNPGDSDLNNNVEDAEYVYDEGRAALTMIDSEESKRQQAQLEHKKTFAPSLKKLTPQPELIISSAGLVKHERSAATAPLLPTTSVLLKKLLSDSLARKASGALVSGEALLEAFPERENFVQQQTIKRTLEQLRNTSRELSSQDRDYVQAEIKAALQQLEPTAQ